MPFQSTFLSNYSLRRRPFNNSFVLPQASGVSDAFIVKYLSNGSPDWVTRIGGIGGNGVEVGYGIATDSVGNVYVTGYYTGTTTVFAVPGVADGTERTLSNSGNEDVFIAKYLSNGNTAWATRISSIEKDLGNEIATDFDGNVYVTGTISTSIATAFAVSGSNITLANSIEGDAFIVKYLSNGNIAWATKIAGSNKDSGNGIATDSVGNVYVTGYYTQDATVYAVTGVAGATNISLTNSGNEDVFIAKYLSNGNTAWATRIVGTPASPSTGNDVGNGIVTDSVGNVYVTGNYYGAATIYVVPGVGGFDRTLTTSGGTDAFIVKYFSNGNIAWAARIGGTSQDTGTKIATDFDGNVYATGTYSLNFTAFTVNGGTDKTLTVSGTGSGFIVKYLSNGNAAWAARIDAASDGIATDSVGNVYITGTYSATATFTTVSGGTNRTLTNSGGTDACIVKYLSNGYPEWAARIAGTATDSGNGIATDFDGNVYVTGNYSGTATAVRAGL